MSARSLTVIALKSGDLEGQNGHLPAIVIVAVSPLMAIVVPKGFDALATRCRM